MKLYVVSAGSAGIICAVVAGLFRLLNYTLGRQDFLLMCLFAIIIGFGVMGALMFDLLDKKGMVEI